jgi:hypothetical protein
MKVPTWRMLSRTAVVAAYHEALARASAAMYGRAGLNAVLDKMDTGDPRVASAARITLDL